MTIIEVGNQIAALPDAPPKLAPYERRAIFVELPRCLPLPLSGTEISLSYVEAEKLHADLGQALAHGMRRRQPA